MPLFDVNDALNFHRPLQAQPIHVVQFLERAAGEPLHEPPIKPLAVFEYEHRFGVPAFCGRFVG